LDLPLVSGDWRNPSSSWRPIQPEKTLDNPDGLLQVVDGIGMDFGILNISEGNVLSRSFGFALVSNLGYRWSEPERKGFR